MIKRLKAYFSEMLYSLKTQLFFVIIYGVLVAVGVYLITHFISSALIERVYLSEENKELRRDAYIDSLQDFIDENSLSSLETQAISRWVRSNRYVYLLIYNGDELLLSLGIHEDVNDAFIVGGGGLTVDYPNRDELIEYAKANDLFPIEMTDGTLFVSLADFTEYLYYDVANMVSLILSMIALSATMMLFFRDVARRITRLAADVNIISEGDTEHQVFAEGEDEISRLGENVENMRTSMLENLKKERDALDANAELITSLSHDIRTPLTVLLGYLDIMRMHAEDETMKSYIEASHATAMKLKNLSDDIFRHFLIEEGETVIQEYDAERLIEQLVSEHILLLREQGCEIKTDVSLPDGISVVTDAPKLMRIVDNLFSNLGKYSDPAHPIIFSLSSHEGFVDIVFENRIAEKNTAQSTGIGLRTCRRLSEKLGIIFDAGERDGVFRASVSIPAKTKNPPKAGEK